MRRQRGGQKKLDPSWLAARPAGCAASHHTRPEIRNPPIVRTTHSGFGLRRLCKYETTPEITGIVGGYRAAGGNRSASPRAWDETNVRYRPLIGHSETPLG